MTNRFSKLLSVILSLAMLVSMCGVTTFADGTEPETGVYYVQYGASGDGLSAETPAGTLETVKKGCVKSQYCILRTTFLKRI